MAHHRDQNILCQIPVKRIAEKNAFSLHKPDAALYIARINIRSAFLHRPEIFSQIGHCRIRTLTHFLQRFKCGRHAKSAVHCRVIQHMSVKQTSQHIPEQPVIGHMIGLLILSQNVFHKFPSGKPGKKTDHFPHNKHSEDRIKRGLEKGCVREILREHKYKTRNYCSGDIKPLVICLYLSVTGLNKPFVHFSVILIEMTGCCFHQIL